PYFGFLLASGWDATAKRWVVAALDPATRKDLLENCRLSRRGSFSSQTAGNPADLLALLGGVIGTPANNTEMRYRIVGSSPPITSASGPGSPAWPPTCNALLDPLTNQPTSLNGGAARISVEGQVWRNGRQVASYTLTRTLDVQGSPFPDLPPAWEALSFSPGPPIALRLTGTAVGVGQLTSAIYQNFEEDASPTPLNLSIGRLRPMCRTCTFANGQTTNIPDDDKDLPFSFPQYPFDTDTLPPGVTPQTFIIPPTPNPNPPPPNYPFATPGTPNVGNLAPGCIRSEQLTNRPPGEIDCWIQSIGPGVNLTVNTELRPVNLIILGDVGKSDPAASTNTNLPISGVCKVDSNYVTIKHRVGTTFYNHTNLAIRPFWNRLRIFGVKPDATTNQTFYIRARESIGDPPSLAGTFLWLPRGNLFYGNNNDGTGSVHTLKTYLPPKPPDCKGDSPPEPAPTELLSSWWLGSMKVNTPQPGDLTLNLTGPMRFILPLYGNPEAVSGLLPGGYFLGPTNNPQFVADSRFGVYPLLHRIRSAY
ncbi:MAG: hypothetical protein ACKOYK_12275, partial [Cyanobium sp.]